MKICVIINPNAGSAAEAEQLERLIAQRKRVTCLETAEAGDGARHARQAVEDGADLVVAAGGDGTVNEVVNGLMGCERRARLGIVPLGTGNDLARTLALPVDPRDAFALLDVGKVQPLDLIRLESDGTTRFGINAAAGGFSGEVDEVLSAELKEQWGPLAYLIGAVSALPDLKNYQTFIRFDDEPAEAVEALNVIVANGRTVAGGRRVAPAANPQDGLLDVVVVQASRALELAEVGAKLLAGNYLTSPSVLHRQVRRVEVTSHPGMWFNIDGELYTKEPVVFRAEPAALEVIVGTDYRAEPDLGPGGG